MISLKSKDKFEITGRGPAFVFDQDKYTAEDMRILMRRKRVIKIDEKEYTILGVEYFPSKDPKIQYKFGLLVKPADIV